MTKPGFQSRILSIMAAIVALMSVIVCTSVAVAETSEEFDQTQVSEKESGEDVASIEAVTVRSERLPHEGVMVQTMDRESIRELGAVKVVDALDSLPAVQASTGSRGEKTFILRGFDQRQVMVLVDGLPVFAPYTGQIDLGKVPSEVVERIVVLKGAGSVRYGPAGLGGAVNIITRQPGSGPFLDANLQFGMLDDQLVSLAVSDTLSPVHFLLTAGFEHSNGFRLSRSFDEARNEKGGLRDNSDRLGGHVLAKISLDPAKGHRIQAEATYFQGAYGVPRNIYSRTPRFWRWSDWRDLNVVLSHSGEYAHGIHVKETFHGAFLSNTLDSYDDDSYSTQDGPRAFTSTHDDRILGGRLDLSVRAHPTGIDALSFSSWFDAREDRHESREEGEEDDPPLSRFVFSSGLELEAVWNRVVSTSLSLLTEVERLLDVPDNLQAETDLFFGPALEVNVSPHPDVTLELVAARRGRMPTLSERYSSAFGTRETNPDLSAETAYTFGLDVNWTPMDWFLLQVGGFESEVVDLIAEAKLGDGTTQIQNVDRVRLAGAEANVAFNFDFGLRVEGGYAYLYSKRLNADSPDDRLEYHPTHKGFIGLREQPFRWLRLTTRFQAVGGQDYQDEDTGKWGELDPYYVWNARIDLLPTDGFSIWLKADNILDADYQPRHGYPASGFTAWLGLRVTAAGEP